MRILLITISERPWTLYRDANEYLIQIEDTKNSQTEKTLTFVKDISVQGITNLQSRITLISMLWSEGYHKNTVYRVIFAMLFLPPITLPFYTCKKFWPVFILPRQSRYKHSYSKIVLDSLRLKFAHWQRGRKEHILYGNEYFPVYSNTVYKIILTTLI